MKRRHVLILVGVLIAVVAVGAIVFLMYVRSLTALKPLEISFATVPSVMPEGALCAGGGQEGGVAKEILNLETDYIYVAGGTNPIPDDVWQSTSFRLPLLQNSTRSLLFNGSCFYRSPGAATTCQGGECFIIEEIAGYTWLMLTQIVGQACFPDASGCNADVVNPGFVSINTIAKCQRIQFDGPTIYELSDGVGNRYVMHATDDGTPDLDPSLPKGWTLAARTIDAPLVLLPSGGGDSCYYNIVRDNLVQSYHQVSFAGERYPG
jgi:hypothetical protein